jgi:5S rRNA maturation endonuclease (ribonuclease M5)
MRAPFQNHWGLLTQIQIPAAVFAKQQLVLGAGPLACYLVLLYIAKQGQVRKARRRRRSTHSVPSDIVEFQIPLDEVSDKTGLSRNAVSLAVRELQEQSFLFRETSRQRTRGQFASSSFILCNPRDGQPIHTISTNIPLSQKMQYFNIPDCVITHREYDWSVSKMTGSELRIYVALCWMANTRSTTRYSSSYSEIARLARISPATLKKGLEGLATRKLVFVFPTDSVREVEVQLCDPYSGEPFPEQIGDPENDPANYFVPDSGGVRRRVIFNRISPEVVEGLIKVSLTSENPIQRRGNGELMISCPFHTESTPSCSVSTTKGCFNCFGCHRKGSITDLLSQMRGVSKAQAWRIISGESNNPIEYNDPDSNIETIYPYIDKNGRTAKQVLRYRDKRFLQRRPGTGGDWIYNTAGVRPLLYNALRLQYATTVILCEGEKDCETVMNLGLVDSQGSDVIGSTSGGSDSWIDALADDLTGKRVILIPDDDPAGERYAAQVGESLNSRSISHTVVNLHNTGAKDVSDFIASGRTAEDLVALVGHEWIRASTPSSENYQFEEA